LIAGIFRFGASSTVATARKAITPTFMNVER